MIVYLCVGQTYEIFDDVGQAVAATFMLAVKKWKNTQSVFDIRMLHWESCWIESILFGVG